MSGNVWGLGFNLLALCLFFGKRRYFPAVYIAFNKSKRVKATFTR